MLERPGTLQEPCADTAHKHTPTASHSSAHPHRHSKHSTHLAVRRGPLRSQQQSTGVSPPLHPTQTAAANNNNACCGCASTHTHAHTRQQQLQHARTHAQATADSRRARQRTPTMGYWVGTLIFLGIQIIATVCINMFEKNSRHGLAHTLAITSVVQCWFLWSIVYIAQMHPLIQPGNK